VPRIGGIVRALIIIPLLGILVNTMKLAIFASLLASAAAFAPAKQASASTMALSAFEGELGVQQPLGYWDPLGLVADGDKTKFDRLRYVELKHGRISMLAVAGYLTTAAGVRIPGDVSESWGPERSVCVQVSRLWKLTPIECFTSTD
jgi:hypothetical protein